MFQWTCTYPETSHTVLLLLSLSALWACPARLCQRLFTPSCCALSRPWLSVGSWNGGDAEGRSSVWFTEWSPGELFGLTYSPASLPGRPALGLNNGRHWQAQSLWDEWLDLLSIALYSPEWEIICFKEQLSWNAGLKNNQWSVCSVSLRIRKAFVVVVFWNFFCFFVLCVFPQKALLLVVQIYQQDCGWVRRWVKFNTDVICLLGHSNNAPALVVIQRMQRWFTSALKLKAILQGSFVAAQVGVCVC